MVTTPANFGSPADGTESATLGSVLSSIWRHRLLVAGVTLAMVAAAYGLSLLQPEVYRAESRVFLTNPADTFGEETSRSRIDPDVYTIQQVTRVTATPVLRQASERLGGRWSVADLETMVDVEPEAEFLVLRVGANAPSAEDAGAITGAVTAAYGAFNESTYTERAQVALDEIEKSRKQLQKQLKDAQAALNKQQQATSIDGQQRTNLSAEARVQTLTEELLAAENSARTLAIDAASSGIDFVEQARTPEEPVQPKPARNAALGGAVGFVAAAALADILSRRRRRLDPATLLGAPLLANIPNFDRSGGTIADPLFDIDAAEAYQFLLASFEYAVARTQATSILVTSPSSGDGKSITALQLARAIAMQGRNVTLVDADIRAGGLTSLLHAEQHPGLVSMAGGEPLDEVARLYRISHGVRLRVVPLGQPPQAPTGLLTTDKYRDAISAITGSTDLTIIDGGPLLTVADASALAMQVSGVLLVLDAETDEDELLAVQQRLRLIPTPLIGYVVNRSPEARTSTPYPSAMSHAGVRRHRRSVAEVGEDGHAPERQQERVSQH